MNTRKWTIVVCLIMLFVVPYALNVSAKKEPKAAPLTDNRTVYKNDNPAEVKEVYITVYPLDNNSKKYVHSFRELNRDIDFQDDEVIKVKVLFQEGKDGTPKQGYFGYGLTDANGVMKLRGHSTRKAEQKSYKIELNKKGGLWNGFKVINLNKHPLDRTKVRNKLSYDFLKKVQGITSARTQFVHVYIKDYSEGDYTENYEDYGLFTHVENIDTDYLKNHGLDRTGNLYKVENFEFFRYLDKLQLKDNDDYSKTAFEEVLEIRGNDNHEKLLRMMDDVNNKFIHINEVIRKHFNRDNYLTWLAVNILFGNFDTNNQNYYLYSPKKGDAWYFIPWDFDGSWGYYDNNEIGKAPWQEGISNYWGNVLHRRFLENRENLADLNEKIESLAGVFAPEEMNKLLTGYRPIVFHYLSREPDNRFYSWDTGQIGKEFDRFPELISKNKEIYYQNIQKPMPVHMASPIKMSQYYIFKWDKSFDLQGDWVEYSIEISSTPGFEKIIHRKEGIRDTEYLMSGLAPGKYYWRLSIRDSKGNTQAPFNVYTIYKDSKRKSYYGVQQFFVQ